MMRHFHILMMVMVVIRVVRQITTILAPDSNPGGDLRKLYISEVEPRRRINYWERDGAP